MYRWNGKEQFPVLITIFSAANYCDAYNNKGAIIKFSVLTDVISRVIRLTFSNSYTTHILTSYLTL
jgi:hypothetical protein